MEITTYLHTYKWIGDYWGKLPVYGWTMDMDRDGTITLNRKDFHNIHTCHTPEQLVTLGYMELIETKPEEKPTEDFWAENTILKEETERQIRENIMRNRAIDKAMEIPKVEYYNPNFSDMEWRDKIVSSLNAVIKKINNL